MRQMNNRRRALLASAVGAALLLAPASTMAGKPVKTPPCTVSGGVTVQTVKVKGVTTIYVTGTTGSDVIDCTAATSRVVAHGVAGSGTGDTIYGGSKNDDLYVENNGAGQTDYAIGNGGNDTIHAGGGSAVGIAMGDDFNPSANGGADDTIIATGGFVQFYGGAGNDHMDVSAATGSAVEGNAGNDTVIGSPGHDSLYGGAGDDILTDSSGATELFDCGDGTGDVLNDLDGNGTGGWSGQAEDDTHVGCETVNVDTTAPCSYTPGTTGCLVLTNVSITDNPSTATYLISGTVTFTPTCNPLVAPCD
jgi:Ca2+-binding RTX toxin-like protein